MEKKINWFNQHSSNIFVWTLLLVIVIQTVWLFSIEKQFESFKENLLLTEQITSKNENLKLIDAFKEDAYIRHQERDTMLILSMFGLITFVFGFFTYKSVREEFGLKINIIEKKFESNKSELLLEVNTLKEEFSNTINEVNDIKFEFYSNLSTVFNNLQNQERKNKNYNLSLLNCFISLDYAIKTKVLGKNIYNLEFENNVDLEILRNLIIDLIENNGATDLLINQKTYNTLKKRIIVHFANNDIEINEFERALMKIKFTKKPLN